MKATNESVKRAKGIYDTDFAKPISVNIEGVRMQLDRARGQLSDLMHEYPQWKERIDHVHGLLTCGIATLYDSMREIAASEIQSDDARRGKSLVFQPRGIGLDITPGCFVCGAVKRSDGANDYMNNIAAFVATKEEGEEIVSWFARGARLDFRPSEPKRIQAKIGACDAHKPKLESLSEVASVYGRLRKQDVLDVLTH